MEWEKSVIQKMDIQDLDEVFSIEASSSPSPWSRNSFAEEMQNSFAHCFVMKRGNGSEQRVIGFICFRNVIEESELLDMGVHPEYREMGIGKKLMQFYIDFSHRRGIHTFYLEVNVSNQSAIHLYQSFAYQFSGVRKKFYQGKSDALLMTKRI
jgi:ribosomal-protein-alanine N-acetyltransferase